MGVDDEGLLVRFGDDFRRVFARYAGPPVRCKSPDATYRTPFGVERHGLGYGQPIRHPLADATLREIHDYAWPDPAWMDVSQIRAEALAYDRQYAILGGDWSPFWHDAIDLLGMEDLLLKMHDEPALVDAVCCSTSWTTTAACQPADLRRGRRRASTSSSSATISAASPGRWSARTLFARFLLPHLAAADRPGPRLRAEGAAALLRRIRAVDPADDRRPAWTPCTPCSRRAGAWTWRSSRREFGRQIVFNGAIDSHHVLIQGTPDSVRRHDARGAARS